MRLRRWLVAVTLAGCAAPHGPAAAPRPSRPPAQASCAEAPPAVPPAASRVRVSEPHWEWAGTLLPSPRGLVAAVGLRHVQIWDTASRTLVRTHDLPPATSLSRRVEWGPSGEEVVPAPPLPPGCYGLRDLAYDGDRVAGVSDDGALVLATKARGCQDRRAIVLAPTARAEGVSVAGGRFVYAAACEVEAKSCAFFVVDAVSGEVTRVAGGEGDLAEQPETIGSADGRLVIASLRDEIVAWQVGEPRARWRTRAREAMHRGLALLPRQLVATRMRKEGSSLQVLELETGREIAEMGKGTRKMQAAFLEGESIVALAKDGKSVSVWSPSEGRVVRRLREESGTLQLLHDSTRQLFVVRREADSDCFTLARGIEEEAPRRFCIPGVRPSLDLSFLPGRALLSVDGVDALLDVASGAVTRLERCDAMHLCDWLRPAGGRIVGIWTPLSKRQDGSGGTFPGVTRALVWDSATGKVLRELPVKAPIHPSLSPAGDQVALATQRSIEIVALTDGRRVRTIPLSARPKSVFWDEDGSILVTTREGGEERYQDGVRVSAPPVARPAVPAARGLGVPNVTLEGNVEVDGGGVQATLVEFEDDETIAYTPGGAYAATPEAAARVGWVFERPVEAFRFEQFASTFARPDLVRRRLAGERVDVDAAAGRPPRVEIVGAPRLDGDRAVVRARVRSESRVDRVQLFVEGRPAEARAVCAADAEIELSAPLAAGKSRVTVRAFDARGVASNPVERDIVRPPGGARPELWVASIGVSRYPRLPAEFQLEWADDDARGIASALAGYAGEGRAYARAHVELLVDGDADVAHIRAALAKLSAAHPEDVVVIFFAGHGVKTGETGDARLLSTLADTTPEGLRAHTVGWSEIGAALEKIPGRTLVLLDACHSGHVTQRQAVPSVALASELARGGRAGAVVFAAAIGSQPSYEPGGRRGLSLDAKGRALVSAAGEHGFFTGAILGALRDRATDRDGDGAIQVSELIDDVTTRVRGATNDAQTPWVARREVFGDFRVVPAAR